MTATIALADPPPADNAQPSLDTEQLATHLKNYFDSDTKSDRVKLARKIESMESISINAVAEALRDLDLWRPQEPGVHAVKVDCPRGPRKPPKSTTVHVRIPDSYDHTKPYPLLFALHGTGGDGAQYLPFAVRLLGDAADQYVIAAPTDYQGVWLGGDLRESNDIPTILRTLKRAYHIDSDRVYVTGYSLGGHASFVIAALYGDYFAASAPLAGTFALQAGWEAVELLLPNVRGVPILAVYGELDRNDRLGKRDENSGISGSNRQLARILRRIDAPIELIELPGVGHRGVNPPAEKYLEHLSRRRQNDRKVIEHWFRYPAQGRAAWLRQQKFAGRMWRSQKIVVQPSANETYSEAMMQALKDRLAFLGGRINGQTVRITTRKCATVTLLVNQQLIDLTQPITIYLNGTRRFEGVAHPRIATLLEMAYEDWDLDRLWSVRFEIAEKGRAILN